MSLADKITYLRKKKGWSQEELSNQLGVSRQAVSKWESSTSIPDLDKIIKMSEIFGVSTDYLLKDDYIEIKEEIEQEDYLDDDKSIYRANDNIRNISMETAYDYINLVKNISFKIALGVSICILSTVPLIVLDGISDLKGMYNISESYVIGFGLTSLVIMVAIAVGIFLIYGKKMEEYDYLKTEFIELPKDVKEMIENEKREYQRIHNVKLVIGIVIFIISIVPIIIISAIEKDDTLSFIGVGISLFLVAFGVFFVCSTSMINGSFKKLLEEDGYKRSQKMENKNNGPISNIYWCSVFGIYLLWSFYTGDWGRSWIILPVAGVFHEVVIGVKTLIKK